MDKNMNRILQELASSAADAADEARAAARSAGKVVSEKYDAMKLGLELARLRRAQDDVLCEAGRMLFMMHTGEVKDVVETEEGEKSPRQVIDAQLVKAEQLQQEMTAIEDKLRECGAKVCPKCGRLCGARDAFCAVCGEKLPEEGEA